MAKKSKSKGKSPKGRAGQKQRAQGGSPFRSARHLSAPRRLVAIDSDDEDDGYDAPDRMFKGFAQTGASSGFIRDPTVKLRYQAITFVSAGSNTPYESSVGGSRGKPHPTDGSVGREEQVIIEHAAKSNLSKEPMIQIPETAMSQLTVNDSQDKLTTAITPVSLLDLSLDGAADEMDTIVPDASIIESNQTSSEAPLFVVDTMGDTSLAPPPPRNAKEASTRSNSNLSESDTSEKIVFHGRSRPKVVDDPVQPKEQSRNGSAAKECSTSLPAPSLAPHSQQLPSDHILSAFDEAVKARQDVPHKSNPPPMDIQSVKPTGWAAQRSKHEQEVDLDAKWAPAPAGAWWRQKGATASAASNIAQLQADWKLALRDKKGKKKPLSDDIMKLDPPKSSRRRKHGRKKDNRELRAQLDSDGEDAAGEAAYDDYMANLLAQADAEDENDVAPAAFTNVNSAHNAALGGSSMMIDGLDVADDEIYRPPGTQWSSEGSDNHSIGKDYEGLHKHFKAEPDTSDLDSSALENILDYEEKREWADEDDLRRQRLERKTDEQIARLFAKQQELGIDDDELVLEDGIFTSSTEDDSAGDIAAARAAAASMGRSQMRPKKTTRRGGGPTFADASALADVVDQYGENGFDIMDFDRPSLRATKRPRKGKLPPELEALSDDDLRLNISQAWENDRAKKSAKRAERKALRAVGSLKSSSTRTGTTADLRTKYGRGMTTAQIHIELREFLVDVETTSLPFPPMAKRDRQELHQIAMILGLKSKSAGNGSSRYPVLYKTKATRSDTSQLDAAVAAADRGWLGWRKALSSARGPRAGRGGGFDKAAVSLRNGEIVGAGADEIGKENFGHRMMERMGWSRGQALGATGEGRLLPVEQIMRSGRAGLG